ncbi:ABC transporter ATP-binding protein [Microbacterium paludicola]|uniref:ABC transporter ATP-binding protein n=1 Tax=Microbacterium paludicola TaxID=300019 RepID=UPI00387920D7
MSAEIRIEGLEKRYETPSGGVLAVADVTLDVAAGEFVAVVGASGCGKSTLLRILAGFEAPSGGTVTVAGAPITGPGPDRGVVFQDYGLFPWLTVHENVAYGPARRGLARADARAKADLYLETVGLTRFAKKFPGELSGGMQQRVAIARVLANDPAVMLMDEPFGALDALTRSDLQVQLRGLQRAEGRTVVFITHSIEEAVYLADRVVVMTGGASHGVPGHIREIVPIPLAEDRDVTSPAFNAFKRQISALVHERAAA